MRRPDLYDVFISAKSADYEHAGKKIRTLLAKNGSSLVYNNVDYGPPLDWFTDLGESLTEQRSSTWYSLVATCLYPGQGSTSWNEASLRKALESLSRTIPTNGGAACPGVLVGQDVKLLVRPQLDQNGSLGVKTSLLFPNITNVGQPISLGCAGSIAYQNGEFQLNCLFGPANDPNPGTLKASLQGIPLDGSIDAR